MRRYRVKVPGKGSPSDELAPLMKLLQTVADKPMNIMVTVYETVAEYEEDNPTIPPTDYC